LKLSFLTFDITDDADGACTLEAMASVRPEQQDAVLAEVAQVINWACKYFPGGPQSLDDGGDWDVLLQAQVGDGPPHNLLFEPPGDNTLCQVFAAATPPDCRWVCVTLTLGTSPAFAQAVAEAGWA
jgi:hypothetical protein